MVALNAAFESGKAECNSSFWVLCAEHEAEKLNRVIQHPGYMSQCCYIALQSLFQTSLTKGYFLFAASTVPCHWASSPSLGFMWRLAGPWYPSRQRLSTLGASASVARSRYISFFLFVFISSTLAYNFPYDALASSCSFCRFIYMDELPHFSISVKPW